MSKIKLFDKESINSESLFRVSKLILSLKSQTVKKIILTVCFRYVPSSSQVKKSKHIRLKFDHRGHSITMWEDEGCRGSKMSVFVHTHGIKTVHAGRGSKMAKFCPRS